MHKVLVPRERQSEHAIDGRLFHRDIKFARAGGSDPVVVQVELERVREPEPTRRDPDDVVRPDHVASRRPDDLGRGESGEVRVEQIRDHALGRRQRVEQLTAIVGRLLRVSLKSRRNLGGLDLAARARHRRDPRLVDGRDVVVGRDHAASQVAPRLHVAALGVLENRLDLAPRQFGVSDARRPARDLRLRTEPLKRRQPMIARDVEGASLLAGLVRAELAHGAAVCAATATLGNASRTARAASDSAMHVSLTPGPGA